MKRAFIILAPGNSGSRFLTKIFIESGCIGDDGHRQPFDIGTFPPDGKNIVWKTHNPEPEEKEEKFSYSNVSIERCIRECESRGYAITVLILYRDINVNSVASVSRGYRFGEQRNKTPLKRTVAEEEKLFSFKFIKFYRDAFEFLERNKMKYTCCVVDYSELISSKNKYLELVGRKIDYRFSKIKFIKNENKKHL